VRGERATGKKKGKQEGERKRKRERERERERESPTNQVLYREKSSLLVRRKKLRLKILSWGRETLLASARKGGRGAPGEVEYEVNARDGDEDAP